MCVSQSDVIGNEGCTVPPEVLRRHVSNIKCDDIGNVTEGLESFEFLHDMLYAYDPSNEEDQIVTNTNHEIVPYEALKKNMPVMYRI